MKKSLSHLPREKQDELEIIKNIILEKIPDVRMLVLFGSYARDEWVEDTHTEGHVTHVYESDYDILVATKSKKAAEDSDAQDRVEKAIEATGKVKTPYGILYHSFGYVNQMITEGHYFFADIKKEGIHLYKKDSRHSLAKAKVLTPAERKQIAQEHFEHWFEKGENFHSGYEHYLKRGNNNEAAFLLHQATECFYSAVTLVFVNYRFRTHDIERLSRKAVSYDADFADVFPRDTAEQRTAFNLLRRAYIDARYKDSYEITKEQLEYLAERVKKLRDLAEKICREKIETFA